MEIQVLVTQFHDMVKRVEDGISALRREFKEEMGGVRADLVLLRDKAIAQETAETHRTAEIVAIKKELDETKKELDETKKEINSIQNKLARWGGIFVAAAAVVSFLASKLAEYIHFTQ